jgi:hypothetical protein
MSPKDIDSLVLNLRSANNDAARLTNSEWHGVVATLEALGYVITAPTVPA